MVFIVTGGPGTGKSVIALNLVAGLSRAGYVTHHATGSKAFTENVRKKVGTKATPLFKYFNSYLGAETNTLDVLVCDEAHRIRQASHTQYTPREIAPTGPRSMNSSTSPRVTVFFLDDLQVVRPGRDEQRPHSQRGRASRGARVPLRIGGAVPVRRLRRVRAVGGQHPRHP